MYPSPPMAPPLWNINMAIYNNDGSFRNETPTETLNFASADTKIINPAVYTKRIVVFLCYYLCNVTKSLEDRVDWTVSQPL